MKVLVTGAGGMVGRATVAHCQSKGDEVFGYDRQQLDITNETTIREIFDKDKPDAVINCAAWTDVDGCESDTKRAYDVNARAPELLAINSRRIGAAFITISTDYVFDGDKDGFYTQRDDPNPQSVYGKAKLDGERLTHAAYARAIVVRSGWIFGPGGKNFLSTIIDRARRGEQLKAIVDSYGTPTYGIDLAARLRELVLLDLPGTYHVVNSGDGVSFIDFARTAASIAGCENVDIEEVHMDSLKRPAPRPRNSRMRCLLSEALKLSPMPDWKTAIRDFAKAGQI
jgi:dTDP-4-dehydrorhamnose reductase